MLRIITPPIRTITLLKLRTPNHLNLISQVMTFRQAQLYALSKEERLELFDTITKQLPEQAKLELLDIVFWHLKD